GGPPAPGVAPGALRECVAKGVDPVTEVKRLAPGPRERSVLLRRDQLVLGPADEVGETAVRPWRIEGGAVVHEVGEPGPQLPEEKPLADRVQHDRLVLEPQLGTMLTEDPVTERMEIMDPEPARNLQTQRLLQPALQL